MNADPSGSLDDAGRDELVRLLTPVLHDMNVVAVDPPTVAPGDWLGPASESCRRLETEVRGRLVQVVGEVELVLAAVRSGS